jgi:hypothetical protein
MLLVRQLKPLLKQWAIFRRKQGGRREFVDHRVLGMDQRQEWLNSTLMELLEAIKASLPEVVWREMWMVSEVHGVVSTKTL